MVELGPDILNEAAQFTHYESGVNVPIEVREFYETHWIKKEAGADDLDIDLEPFLKSSEVMTIEEAGQTVAVRVFDIEGRQSTSVTHKNYRRKGYGRAMINASIEYIISQSETTPTIHLWPSTKKGRKRSAAAKAEFKGRALIVICK